MSFLEEKFSLKNRVAVVLGGTSGIGQAIARGLARAGATTIASSRDSGRVDILVVTSGLLKKMPSEDVPDEDWTRIVDVNLNGTFRANQVFGRQMIRQQRGSIINIGSMTSFVSFSEVAAYGASKGGVL